MSDARKYPILCSLPMLQLLQMCDVHLHLLLPLHHLLPPALADSWPVLAMLRSGFIKMLLLRIISCRSFLSLQRSPAGPGSKPCPPLGCIRWPNPLSTSIQPNCYKHLVHKWLIDLFPNDRRGLKIMMKTFFQSVTLVTIGWTPVSTPRCSPRSQSSPLSPTTTGSPARPTAPSGTPAMPQKTQITSDLATWLHWRDVRRFPRGGGRFNVYFGVLSINNVVQS